MAKCKPVMLSVALQLLLVGCGKDFSLQQERAVQQPATQNPAARNSAPLPELHPPSTPPADPLASAKSLAKSLKRSCVATAISKRVWEAGEISEKRWVFENQKRDYWGAVRYTVLEVAFDVTKTDSLVSPYVAKFELQTLQALAVGGDLKYADAFSDEPTPEDLKENRRFSTEQKAKTATAFKLPKRQTVTASYAWQDNKWVLKEVDGMDRYMSRTNRRPHTDSLWPPEWP